MLSKIQTHTVNIYNLNSKKYQLRRVKARSLLTPKRFDLFAKLHYIANININYEQAVKVYVEHIKIFNPDLKEPGRDDKNSIKEFIDVFNQLISKFETSNFDCNRSLIPVDSNGVILDGAHRVAALAFYNKEVEIIQFDKVYAKCDFDYLYFKKRGLKWDILDIIAQEMTKWLSKLSVAYLITNINKAHNIETHLSKEYSIAYIKQLRIGVPTLEVIYKNIDCSSPKVEKLKGRSLSSFFRIYNMSLFILETNNESNICEYLKNEKKLICILNNRKKATDILEITKSIETNLWINVINTLIEKFFYLRHVKWLNFKVRVASIITNLKK